MSGFVSIVMNEKRKMLGAFAALRLHGQGKEVNRRQ